MTMMMMMLGNTTRTTASQLLRRAAARTLSTEAAPTMVKLNFSLPHDTIYKGASVYSVILPGAEGEYGVAAGHVQYVAQLKPGVLQILHEDMASEPEKYFVAGGYAMTSEDSVTVRAWMNGQWTVAIQNCRIAIGNCVSRLLARMPNRT
jgi:hypothetical protein